MLKPRFFSFLLFISCVLLSAANGFGDGPQRDPLIGEITRLDEAAGAHFGAGCQLSPVGTKDSWTFVFLSNERTHMKIRGVLQPLSRVGGEWPTKKGERTTALYEGAGAKVQLEIEQISQCEEGQECGGTSYRGTVSVTDGNETEKVDFEGVCGC